VAAVAVDCFKIFRY